MSFDEWSNNKKKKKTSSFEEWSNANRGVSKKQEEEDEKKRQAYLSSVRSNDDIAPVKNEEDRTWFKKSEGNWLETILGSGTDVTEHGTAGFLGIGEKLLDAGATLGAMMNRQSMMQAAESEMMFNAVTGKKDGKVLERYLDYQEEVEKGTAEFVAKDLYDEEEIAKAIISDPLRKIGVDSERHSVFGEKSDALAMSAGQLGGQILADTILPGSGMVVMGASTFGSEAESAFQNGAAFDEAVLSSAISTTAEVLTEKIGGVKFGGRSLTEAVFGKLSSKVTGKFAKALLSAGKIGADASAEAVEEILSGYVSAWGQTLTYMDDHEIEELFSNEDALEAAIGGFVLGGAFSGGEALISGRDPGSGLTKSEQAVVDKVVDDTIAQREADGKTLTNSEKSKIRDSVVKQMEKGQIDIDTIESVLGGDTYKAYKETVDSEDALKNELAELRKMKSGDMNDLQTERMNELKGMNLDDTTKRDGLRKNLDDVLSPMLKDSKLSESYRERERRGQAFEADLSKYTGKQRAAVERAVKSGVLNNTYRSHELVDVLSKIEAEKGIVFDYTNNAKLKDSGFAVEGKTVNGFANKSKGSVTLNVQSSKAWQSVVGHEITHVLEGTDAYSELRNALYAYAESKGELEGRRTYLTELYQNMDADIDAELTADLIGDYLFTDKAFIDKLTGNRTLFQKIYDEIKYLWNVATGKEKTEIEKVAAEFDRAWKEFSADGISEADDAGEGDIDYSISVTDKQTLNSLNEQVARGEYDPETNPDGGYYVTYKSMSFWGYDEDGNAILRSPMAEYVDGELSNAYLIPKDKGKLNWYQATETIDENTGLPSGLLVKTKQEGKKSFSYLPASENQHLINEDWSNLYFNLRKKILKNGKWVNSDVPARYNPYEHSSNSMLNDQFTAAYQRDNLVTVKMYVPISEDNGAYRAKWSKDPTGWSDWKSGIVAGKIGKQKDLQRRVYLSRYAAPVEIVPDSEVAQAYKGYLEGTDVAIPDNVVSPNLLSELRKAGVPIEESGKVQYSISEIVDKNNKSYGMGVKLDSTLLDNLSPEERVEMVKERVKELGGEIFTAYDNNGNAVNVTIAESNKKFKNKSGKKVYVNHDMTNYLRNPVKQEAIVLVDELITASSFKGTEPATHPHDWVDNNGKNDWDVWETYIQDKENTVWKAKLRIANSTNGEKILYDVFPIEKVGGVATSDTTPTDDSIAPLPENVNTQFSLSSDSEGNELSLAVQKRFANSKAVDENGNLKVLYHGTASGEFYTFDKSKGNVEGDFGSGFYFTDSEYDVESNYEDGGPDFENKVARLAEQIEAEEEIDYHEAEARAREELYKGGNKFEVHLNIENPAIVGETYLLNPDKYYEEYDREDYDSEEDYEGDVEQLISDDIDQIIWDIENNVDVYSTDGLAEVLWNAVNEGGVDIERLKNSVNDLYLEDSNGNLVGNEVTRQIIESLGYDGIIDPTVSHKWNMDMEEGTTHYIVFKPNQIKDISNQNPTDDPDIRYSISKEGEEYAPVGTPFKELALEGGVAPVGENVARKTPKSVRIASGERSDELLLESLDNYPMKTVEQRIAEKLRATEAEIADNRDLRREAEANYEKQIDNLRARYNSKKNKNTKEANKILQSISRLERLKASVEADFAKRISDLEARAERLNDPKYARAMQKQAKMEADAKWAADLIGDTSTWVDKKIGLQYATNTERRNLRDIVRDANGNVDIAKADAIDDALNGQYNRDEAAKKRELANVRKKYADLKITRAEDAYVQMLGELRGNPDTTLTEKVVTEYYEKHKSKIDTAKVDKVIEMARQDYDSWLNRVNAELKKQGMKEIPYRQGYFPHFTEPKQNFIQKLLNWKTQDNEIPTSIAGLTETFKPTKSWQSFDKTRHSDETDYSFMKGFDSYSEGALDWIYHMDTLQKRRAVENHIRFTHSDEGIQARIKEVYANKEMDANEAQAQIEHILTEAKNPLNNFIQDFTTHTNILAGKKNSLDRTVEQWTNRHIYSVMTNVQNRMSANMVLANVRSALTNFIPITQSWAQVSPVRSLQAAKETIANSFRDDGTVDKSTFLTNRLREVDRLYQTNWDKVLDKAGIMFEIVDNFSSQVIWRSKYNQNLADGMTETQAIRNADQFAENVMAGRSKGNEPTLFNAKNPLVKAFTMFQLEVNNQYGYLFKDVPNDLKAEAEHWKFNLAKGYTAVFVGAYVYNALLEKVTGSDAALDPIAIVEELLRDLGLFGDDEEEEPANIVTNFVGNVAEELPFVGGVLGGGRIPISSAIPYGGEYGGGLKGFVEDVSEGNWGNIGKEMMSPILNVGLPVAGGQLKKTYQGLNMFSDEHPVTGSYTDSGKLRFPVEDTPLNRVQAAVFGQYASENAREYFDNDYAPLSEKQIQEYIDVDMPIKDYWEYREGLKGLSKNEEKMDYISGLDLPTSKKNILANNVLDRKEKVNLENYDDFGSLEEFDFATKNPEKYALAKSVGGYSAYRTYSAELYDIHADKDANGKSINGSRKEKVVNYLNNLGADYYTKILLYKLEYPSDDSYNYELVEYINNRADLTYADRVAILTELGFKVTADGQIFDGD